MFLFILGFLIFVAALIFGARLHFYGNDDFWPKQGVAVIKGQDIASFWDRLFFRIAFHELDNTVYKKLKDVDKNIRFGGSMEFRNPILFLVDPEMLRLILVKDFDHFTNRRNFGSEDELFHKMLFNMNNPPWKETRAVMSPTFTTGKIRRMFEIFNQSSDKLCTFLKQEIGSSNTNSGKEIDMRDVCGRYTMDVIASAAFGVDSQNFKDKNSAFAKMGQNFQNQFTGFGLLRVFFAFFFPNLFTRLGLKLLDEKATNFFSDVVRKTIKHREETGEVRNDFLQLLIESRSGKLDGDDDEPEDTSEYKDKVGQKTEKSKLELTDELILAQCVLFFIAGFDTTETLLMYAAYELALNPDIQNKLAAEVRKIEDKDGKLSYDTVNNLEYLDMVISETLRKYPPVTRTERKCVRDYKVPDSDVVLKKDLTVAIPVWPIHHDPEIYPEPEKFIPERFNKENKAERHPYVYLPFGLGPRNCIAMRFALTEGKAAVAHLISNFKIEPCSKTTIPMEYQTNGNMKPINGMWLTITPRV